MKQTTASDSHQSGVAEALVEGDGRRRPEARRSPDRSPATEPTANDIEVSPWRPLSSRKNARWRTAPSGRAPQRRWGRRAGQRRIVDHRPAARAQMQTSWWSGAGAAARSRSGPAVRLGGGALATADGLTSGAAISDAFDVAIWPRSLRGSAWRTASRNPRQSVIAFSILADAQDSARRRGTHGIAEALVGQRVLVDRRWQRSSW